MRPPDLEPDQGNRGLLPEQGEVREGPVPADLFAVCGPDRIGLRDTIGVVGAGDERV